MTTPHPASLLLDQISFNLMGASEQIASDPSFDRERFLVLLDQTIDLLTHASVLVQTDPLLREKTANGTDN